MQISSSIFNGDFNILWLRRNLRWEDNAVLTMCQADEVPILPIFIFDTDILDKLESKTDLRLQFIHETLMRMNEHLLQAGGAIVTFHGKPAAVLEELMLHNQVKSIFCAEDFEPYARMRDREVADLAAKNETEFNQCIDHVIHHPSQVLKSDGTPYLVYTPYSKQWIAKYQDRPIQKQSKGLHQTKWLKTEARIHSMNSLGFQVQAWTFPDKNVSNSIIDTYGAKRNLPAESANSNLGIHLRFGTISIRALVTQAQQSNDITFLKQLIWREFFNQIMYHFPNSMNEAFKAKYRAMPWKFSEEHFTKWTEGKTGIPIVDAGMRELNTTGTMHNRVRMVVASWLTKNLLIDWRLGERYFASKLLDFDLASNVGSWQWVAGTGCDAAPYFRIFNPFTQAKKFDPDRKYIERWIPEIDSLNYPPPMIDYAASRKECLEFYKKNMIVK